MPCAERAEKSLLAVSVIRSGVFEAGLSLRAITKMSCNYLIGGANIVLIYMEKEIIKRILQLVNDGHVIRFEEDWGENTLTIYIDDAHTHCGIIGGSYNELIKSLYKLLMNGIGLSFAKD